MSKYEDEYEYGRVIGVCNSCGEETEAECCDDGEVWHHDDCDCAECEAAS